MKVKIYEKKDQPNPDYVSVPFECVGVIGNFLFVASSTPPEHTEDFESDGFEDVLWVKLPERIPMHFKAGRWVEWLNPPVGWDRLVPGEYTGDKYDGFTLRFRPD